MGLRNVFDLFATRLSTVLLGPLANFLQPQENNCKNVGLWDRVVNLFSKTQIEAGRNQFWAEGVFGDSDRACHGGTVQHGSPLALRHAVER
jgi:hypothetical protein